jgi:hypothetical protein
MFNVYMDDCRKGPMVPMPGAIVIEVPDQEWVIVRRAEYVVELLKAGLIDNLALDHDMGSGMNGYQLVKWMDENQIWPRGKITVHSWNPVGKDNMEHLLKRNGK